VIIMLQPSQRPRAPSTPICCRQRVLSLNDA
jgi:hypothetical protein